MPELTEFTYDLCRFLTGACRHYDYELYINDIPMPIETLKTHNGVLPYIAVYMKKLDSFISCSPEKYSWTENLKVVHDPDGLFEASVETLNQDDDLVYGRYPALSLCLEAIFTAHELTPGHGKVDLTTLLEHEPGLEILNALSAHDRTKVGEEIRREFKGYDENEKEFRQS